MLRETSGTAHVNHDTCHETGRETGNGTQTLEPIGVLIDRATAVRTAQAEKGDAFGEIVTRFQDMAFGCAYAVLGDFYLAEDAAQEAFLSAWRNLDQLREPKAFPG